MQRTRKNYLTYACMMILFGGLIYGGISGGERFDHLSSVHSVSGDISSFEMFKNIIIGNLSHPLTILLFQIIVILMTVRLFSYLFKYIGQPGVIGEIVAGIALGPSLMGYFFPDFFNVLFPDDSLTNLELFSQVGLVLFMFVIGMELDFGILRNKINETLVISHAGIVVPFFLGIVSSYWVYEEYAASQTAFLPFALFIGISMSITAFPVLARIVQERKMTKTPVGILSLASAANDDVTAWCILAIVIAIAKAGTVTSALFAIGLTVVYILFMFLGVRPFLKKIGSIYANKEVINKTFVSFIFLVLVLSSMTTETIGIHALFGAFMAGVVMPSNMGFRKVMMEKVEDVALVLFLPLFFAYTGLNTQIGLINTPELWGICILFVLVSITGKLGGCTIAARMVGESWKDSLIVGTLMNTRGLMELVALNIGREMGILPPEIFAILVIMALITTFMTTPLLAGVEKIFIKQEAQVTTGEKILLLFGRPESGKILLTVAKFLFGKKLKQQHIVAAHFTQGSDLNPVKAQQYERESFSSLSREASALRVKVDKRYNVTDKLVTEMVELVKEENADILLMGAGPGFMKGDSDRGEPSHFNIPLVSPLLSLVKKQSFNLPGNLLREKIETVLDRVDCTVAIFVNRNFSRASHYVILLNDEKDLFMISYIDALLLGEASSVRVCFLDPLLPPGKMDIELKKRERRAPSQIKIVPFKGVDNTFTRKDTLLLMSFDACCKVSEDHDVYDHLPSFLTIRPGIENEKSLKTEN